MTSTLQQIITTATNRDSSVSDVLRSATSRWSIGRYGSTRRLRAFALAFERANATMKNGEGSLSRPGSQQLPPSVRRDGDEHQAGEGSHRGGVSRPARRSLSGTRKRTKNERLRTPKMACDQARDCVAALPTRSINRRAANLSHYAKRSRY
jgi:hypothetical protein